MPSLWFVVFWGSIAFAFVVAGTYVGTTLALRSYFEGESYGLSDVVRVEDHDG